MDNDTILTTEQIALDTAQEIVAKLIANIDGDARRPEWQQVVIAQIVISAAIERAKAEIIRAAVESLGDAP